MDLKILSGGAANGLVTALADAFRGAAGMGIAGDFGAVGVMRDRVLGGERLDAVILTRAILEQLAAGGHVDPASVRDVGRVSTATATRDGAPEPDVSSAEALRAALLAADAVYAPDTVRSTAGVHFAHVLDRLGAREAVAPKLREFPNGQTAMAAMAAGDDARPLGCTQITEILNTPGVRPLGDLPAGCGLVTTYSAGVLADAAQREAAETLIAILTAPENAAARRKAGFA
ncbi:molybdate ABC transporter substrate-binding protein [Rubrimonas cliftonensis]|uniref:Molybdate transport system substrate-binding protein n=1 Tax=Rubrimonas cliftonensis TaxID=89524 RepID=A0A1H4DLX2_9RHOB|nr:substrate-binding domain-containing protein [Rubrimonas cliftonensis]SEA73607.1 molybdate transport system substrate-binding protein [Rubrimonas cliftonensis]